MTGNQFVACNGMERYKCMSDCKITCDLKAEMNLRTPRLPYGLTSIVPTDFHGLARKARKLPGLSGNKPPVIFFSVF